MSSTKQLEKLSNILCSHSLSGLNFHTWNFFFLSIATVFYFPYTTKIYPLYMCIVVVSSRMEKKDYIIIFSMNNIYTIHPYSMEWRIQFYIFRVSLCISVYTNYSTYMFFLFNYNKVTQSYLMGFSSLFLFFSLEFFFCI